MAVKYNGGVILGADSRTSTGKHKKSEETCFFLQNIENMASFFEKNEEEFLLEKQSNYGLFFRKATAKEVQLI